MPSLRWLALLNNIILMINIFQAVTITVELFVISIYNCGNGLVSIFIKAEMAARI